ncbi:MAG: helix-turn-helix domain-containing protein [Nitrospiraceae bacterium]|nr:MAG: helix-turn-helix domain-containing protein [Nitrospiraceae bacterium]
MSDNCIVILTSEINQQNFYRSINLNGSKVHTSPLNKSLEFIEKKKPSLILLDCSSDACRGISVLKNIKTLYTCIPVIFITERASEDIAIEAFRCGARDYMRKPINIDELRKGIERLLSITKTSREKRRLCIMDSAPRNTASQSSHGNLLPASIANVIAYIEGNLNSQISLDSLAKVAFTSKYHFCKVFKKHMGMSPLKYVAFLRVTKAKELLLRDDLNISDVAWEVGFNDLSNFNKHFKKHTGISPSAYKTRGRRPGYSLRRSTDVHLRVVSSN